jgi:phage terminase large subunit-like protein
MLAKCGMVRAAKAELARRDLAFFIEQTTRANDGQPLVLHDWQRNHFIPMLGASPRGRRIRFHAAPQYGKSIILSKRFPLWLLLNDPLIRIVIITYNEDFCQRFYDALKSALVDVQRMFPKFELSGGLSKGLSTPERVSLRDGTASVVFATIATGFTGLGCDVVCIDDPYRGLEDAQSLSYRALVESFFENKLMPRINELTDIYLMYHAWATGDIGDYAVSKYGFTPVRFAAIADGLGDDPTGRKAGELLSPMRTREFLEQTRLTDPKMFAAMYQGIPELEGDKVFEPWMFDARMVDPERCPKLVQWYRGWDTATKAKQQHDHSATCRMAYDQDGNLWIRGFNMKRVPLAELALWAVDIIRREDDGVTTQIVEEHNSGPALFGYLQALPEFQGLARSQSVLRQGDKRARATALAQLARQKKIYLVREGDWEAFYRQLISFTGAEGRPDDFVDSASIVTTFLRSARSSVAEAEWVVSPYARRVALED